jgi:hypothetical protein
VTLASLHFNVSKHTGLKEELLLVTDSPEGDSRYGAHGRIIIMPLVAITLHV